MSTGLVQLEAGGLLFARARVDADATEQVVARSYRHPALAGRPVVRLTSDRLGQAEDLAMEFLGFGAPEVSAPVAVQQRRSLGFAEWALINDPKNARYALDLVKRMKAAARLAKSKPGHAWDAYTEMAKDLGRSARHFLPPYWEDVGRAFKDLGNQTYAGRALSKSLEAERVHALESDRARRRDVVLEFVLSGCLAGNALSDYGNDLQIHYAPAEAFAIFRDLCVRRTRGGMAPWATLPRDFIKLAKGAHLDGDQELERWLEELIDAPAMGRVPQQFFKSCSARCKRIVARNPAFAVALLRHTRPEPRYYGESKLGIWLELLEEWGVYDYLWEDEHDGAPPLGEPIAVWFGRIVRDEIPAPKRTLDMLEKLAPRLTKEGTPLPLSIRERYRVSEIDVDVLEACCRLGVKVDDPPENPSITFNGWLAANVDHPLRNQDLVESWKDSRFEAAILQGLDKALTCRGGALQRGYRQSNFEQRAFPLAAADRPGITELWRRHTSEVIDQFGKAGLASFESALSRLQSTLWPDALRLFPDLKSQLNGIEPAAMLMRTLQAGVFDEYGLPALEEAVAQTGIEIKVGYQETNIFLTFPWIVLTDKVHAYIIGSDGTITKRELRLPKKCEIISVVATGDDLAVRYRDHKYQGHFHWVSDPAQVYDCPSYGYFNQHQVVTVLPDRSIFLGQQSVRPGDKQLPEAARYLHDGDRFWQLTPEYDSASGQHSWKVEEVDPHTGKPVRQSVPPWFEKTDGGTVDWAAAELVPAPRGAEDSPLGQKNGFIGWKVVKHGDGNYHSEGIDGRSCDRQAAGLFRQPGTSAFLPVTMLTNSRSGNHSLLAPDGSTIIAHLQEFSVDFAAGQVTVLPLHFWHLLKLRDEASSKKLRAISQDECAALFKVAAADREERKGTLATPNKTQPVEGRLVKLLPAVRKLLPTAPERMVVGVAGIIERAEAEAAAFTSLREQASADSRKDAGSQTAVVNRKSDQAAAQWGLPAYHVYGHEGNVSVSAHLSAVATFLKGETSAGELPRTSYLWFGMLEDLPLRCWQTLWRATAARMSAKDQNEVPWLEFLKHWQEVAIGELPGQVEILEGLPEGAKKNTWGGYDVSVTGGKSFSLQNGDDRYIVVENHSYQHGLLPYLFLRYSTAKSPGNPPGYQIKNRRKIKAKVDPTQIMAFIAAVEASPELPLPSGNELAEAAANLSVSPAEIGLIWMGGLNLDNYQHNFLPAELRSALGMKTTDASAARQALRNLNATVLAQLCESVVAGGLTAPFAPDRGPVLRAIEQCWQAKMPKRLQLDAALQKRLSALGRTSRWGHLDHEVLLAMAGNPAEHPTLQPREIEIRAEKDRNYGRLDLVSKNKSDKEFSGASLRSIVQLVGLVHAETPAGHPARAAMPALIKQLTRLLNDNGTLLDLRNVYLHDMGRKKPMTPTEWLNKYVGKTKADAKDGTARVDDGLLVAAGLDRLHQVLVAFRPAKLEDERDVARLNGIDSIEVAQEYEARSGLVSVVAAVKGAGFQNLAKAILARDVPEGQWPQNPNHTATRVVSGIRKKQKLSEEAAMLYAQLLALPEPTAANVCAWNGWTSAQFKKAAAELVEHELVLEATRARAGRSIFLPGEWCELKAPWMPIEKWKLAHLIDVDVVLPEPCPAGGPMVLRPFEELFAAAWQRVVDGDTPRYEEVKRKKKTK
jgi:hypothetical protein